MTPTADYEGMTPTPEWVRKCPRCGAFITWAEATFLGCCEPCDEAENDH
jgi:hypothetical protein